MTTTVALRDDAQLQLDPEAFAIVHQLAEAGAVTRIHLELSDRATFEQRRALGTYFGEMHRALSWWVGDLLNDSEQRDGELYAQVAADTGLSDEALRKRMNVCAAIPVKRRRPGLHFSSHELVYKMSGRDQERWLARAERERLSAAALRELIRAENREEPLFVEHDGPPPVGVDRAALEQVAVAILRDAKPAGDGQHHLIPNEDVARLRAALGEE